MELVGSMGQTTLTLSHVRGDILMLGKVKCQTSDCTMYFTFESKL